MPGRTSEQDELGPGQIELARQARALVIDLVGSAGGRAPQDRVAYGGGVDLAVFLELTAHQKRRNSRSDRRSATGALLKFGAATPQCAEDVLAGRQHALLFVTPPAIIELERDALFVQRANRQHTGEHRRKAPAFPVVVAARRHHEDVALGAALDRSFEQRIGAAALVGYAGRYVDDV